MKEGVIKQLLTSLHQHPDKRNIYGYLTEMSAFRGIFSIVRELIEGNEKFREFLKNLLQDQYFPFEQTIRFLRNVLNHSTSSGLHLKLDDYDIQKDYILSPKQQRLNKLGGSAVIQLDFVYAKYIPQRKGSPDYGVQLRLDFASLQPGMEIEKLVSRHTLYLLAELCFNLSQLADAQLHKAKQAAPQGKNPTSKAPKSASKPKKSEKLKSLDSKVQNFPSKSKKPSSKVSKQPSKERTLTS